MSGLRYAPPVQRGDRVAVLSPSWAGPAHYPAVFEQGLQRLRDVFGLEPVEYPTTRRAASPQERARDVEKAFADPSIAAVLTSIGGEDSIKVMRHLDHAVLADHPKRCLGYSDNVNLLNALWNAGVVGYYGGAVMVQAARGGRMHPATVRSWEAALFGGGEVVLEPPGEFSDEDVDWSDPAALAVEPVMELVEPWTWHGSLSPVTGPTWGGCLEVLDMQLRAGRWLQDPAAYEGVVLLVETSEELPDDTYVYRVLMGLGERGILERCGAVLVARPKTQSHEVRPTPFAREQYAEAQRAAVMRAVDEYAPAVPLVLGLDFGHTEPQVVVPYGGVVTVDPQARTVTAAY